MGNSFSSGYTDSGGGGIVSIIVIAIIVGFVALLASGSGSSSSSSSGSFDGSPYYFDDYDYNYDYYDVPDEYDNHDYEPDVETWDCFDATSYDKNPYNDNYCVSSYGREMYTTDSYAESLDQYYTAGSAGHPYYNSF